MTLFKQVRDHAKHGVNTERQINLCQAEFSTGCDAPNLVLELWPVEQQLSNMIRYFYGSELDCPQHTVNIHTFNDQYFRHSWTKLYREFI